MKKLAIVMFSIVALFVIFLASVFLVDLYDYNHRYSIAMPNIMGRFDYNKKFNIVTVWGIENIIDDDIAQLNINETTCHLDTKDCYERRAVVTGLANQVSIIPFSNDYKIRYSDNNKIIFGDYIGRINGEIDLNANTLIYTIKNAGVDDSKTRRVEILTDNEKIKKLEKKIIRKYLKIKLFGR